ncbi:MAG: type II toxin-antitoxin system RelE/ParE family toxin [Cocleimonas sp.]|nr:type II toxin-antitoxin system RelE/ParE family toxin [Cocleimonas sp.]
MKLRYTDRAKEDIEIAILWYEKQQKGLGFDFFDCIKKSERLITNQPKMYAVSYSIYRSCVIKRFPFSIYYTIENSNEIIVHSVFDNRQNPDKKP